MIIMFILPCYTFFFFNDTATTEIYTLSLHDALPISDSANNQITRAFNALLGDDDTSTNHALSFGSFSRSEEHTSELQSQSNLVCRLLLEKKKKYMQISSHNYYNTLYIFYYVHT